MTFSISRWMRAVPIAIGWTCALHAMPSFAKAPWPSGPISYVVPYPPGGTTDIVGRLLAQRLGTALQATVIVDNRPGATGTIGGAFVARSQADGHTLLGTSIGPQAIAPHLMELSYDPSKAYEAVALVGTVPHLLVVPAVAPYANVAQLVKAARDQDAKIAFGSGGSGTILHMQGELLRLQSHTPMVHVPYKGDVPALQDVAGGQLSFMFAPLPAALPLLQSGKLRALAISSKARDPRQPDVPTMIEAGFPDFVAEQWQAVYAPAGTPQAVVQRLQHEISAILRDADTVARLERVGIHVVNGTPAQLVQRQADDSARWAQVIRQAGIKLD